MQLLTYPHTEHKLGLLVQTSDLGPLNSRLGFVGKILAQVVGIPVGQCSGGRLATT